MKWQLPIIMALLCIGIAQACIVNYATGDNITIIDDIIPAGEGSDCNITTYNETAQVHSAWMNRTGLLYSVNVGTLPKGEYTSGVECNYTYNATLTNLYHSECKFEVSGDNDMYTAIGILMIGAIAVLGYFARRTEDNIMKILLTVSTVFLVDGAVFLAYLIAQEQASAQLSWMLFVLFVIVALISAFVLIYTIIMFVQNLLEMVAKKKENA